MPKIPNFIIAVAIWWASKAAGATHNACLHTDSLSFDYAIVCFIEFEM